MRNGSGTGVCVSMPFKKPRRLRKGCVEGYPVGMYGEWRYGLEKPEIQQNLGEIWGLWGNSGEIW